jgi:hypothetical protein
MTGTLKTVFEAARPYRATALFAASVGFTVALMKVAEWLPSPVSLEGMNIACNGCARTQADALALFALQARWLAFALLLITAAAGAVAAAVVTLIGVASEQPAGDRRPGLTTALVALVGLLAVAIHVVRLNWCSSQGFLSSLLGTVSSSGGKGDVIRQMVWPMRSIGEGAALLVGAAMASTASPVTDARTLARRIERLQLLLYCSSLLFVAGILTSESNFTWITAHWATDPENERLATAIADIVKAGTLQSGAAYSALLVIYFLPARSVLGWQARRIATPSEANDRAEDRKALEAAGLIGSWRDDLKQVLALLAPVLSAPLLDALIH